MGRLRNRGHELVAQALADGKSRAEAFADGGFPPNRGNHNRMAKRPDIIARVEEIRRESDEVVDLRKLDRGRILIELARISCADVPLRAAIARGGPEVLPRDQSVLHVQIRLEGVLAKHIEMRLLDDSGALSALLRYGDTPSASATMDFSPSIPADFVSLERLLRAVLHHRERPTE